LNDEFINKYLYNYTTDLAGINGDSTNPIGFMEFFPLYILMILFIVFCIYLFAKRAKVSRKMHHKMKRWNRTEKLSYDI